MSSTLSNINIQLNIIVLNKWFISDNTSLKQNSTEALRLSEQTELFVGYCYVKNSLRLLRCNANQYRINKRKLQR